MINVWGMYPSTNSLIKSLKSLKFIDCKSKVGQIRYIFVVGLVPNLVKWNLI
jgi:hypothetical protein